MTAAGAEPALKNQSAMAGDTRRTVAVRERLRLGARGRIGVIQPAPGVVLEHEWPMRLPPGVMFPVGRVRMRGGSVADYAAVAAAAPAVAQDLVSAGAGVIAYACSVGSLYAGLEAESRLTEALASAASRPAVSLSRASMQALAHLGARRIAIVTPYGEETNRRVTDYVQASGLEVAEMAAFPVGLVEVGDLSPDEVTDVCADVMAACPNAEALWIPCTAVQTLEALDGVERRSGRPAVSGSQALLWAALRALGIGDAVAHTGGLLRHPSVDTRDGDPR